MLINILSGIWFYPITILFNKSREEQLNDIKKLQLEYGFTRIINLDDELKFWWYKTEQYLPEIQEQIDKNNLNKIEKKFKSYLKIIKNTSLTLPEQSILFVSINSIECMYALHLYIYLKYTNIANDNRQMALGVVDIIKNKYSFQIDLDNRLKTLIL
jgi:Flp pilus assembly CpaF family ATPase